MKNRLFQYLIDMDRERRVLTSLDRWRLQFKRLSYVAKLFAGKLAIGSVTLSVRKFAAAICLACAGAGVLSPLPGAATTDCGPCFGTGKQLIRDYGVVSEKKVTGAFVTDIVANLVTDTTAFGDYKYHDSGTGSTAEANTQTALVTPWSGARSTGTQVAGGTSTAPTYTSVATTSYTGTYSIVEHAIFNASSSGTMMDRSLFSAVAVVNGESIQFTYVLTLNAEA